MGWSAARCSLAISAALEVVTEDLLREITDILVRVGGPERIILFGSHATGRAGPASDVNLLVVEKELFGPSRARLTALASTSMGAPITIGGTAPVGTAASSPQFRSRSGMLASRATAVAAGELPPLRAGASHLLVARHRCYAAYMSAPEDDEEAARARARARGAWPIARYRLGEEPGDDLSATTTSEERLAMMWTLAMTSFELSGQPLPDYHRSCAPGRLLRTRVAGGRE